MNNSKLWYKIVMQNGRITCLRTLNWNWSTVWCDSPWFPLFQSVQQLHKKATKSSCSSTGSSIISCSTSNAVMHGRSLSRTSSNISPRHHCFAYLQVINKCPPSSKYFWQTTQRVSSSTPLLGILIYRGWLLWASLQRKWCTIGGHWIFHSFLKTSLFSGM
jgi:hypothetical protein